jgi:hypothetical protein
MATRSVILHGKRDFSGDMPILRHGRAAMAEYPGFGILDEF